MCWRTFHTEFLGNLVVKKSFNGSSFRFDRDWRWNCNKTGRSIFFSNYSESFVRHSVYQRRKRFLGTTPRDELISVYRQLPTLPYKSIVFGEIVYETGDYLICNWNYWCLVSEYNRIFHKQLVTENIQMEICRYLGI